MFRLGTVKASCRTSWPAVPSTARGSPLSTEAEIGTSLSFSSRRVAVTITSCTWEDVAAGVASAAFAGGPTATNPAISAGRLA